MPREVGRIAMEGMLLTACAPIALAVASQLAHGQDIGGSAAPAPTPAHTTIGIGEIIVTAQRRAESSQKVPISLTALNQEQLNAERILTTQDLAGRVPSLVINSGGTNRNNESPAVRGMGRTIAGNPGVVTYFAEAAPPLNGVTGSQGGGIGLLFDLESLQVLKGPQGTLFGRNTTGGALVIEPKKPVFANEGYVQGELGNYDMARVEAAVNVKLSDTLAVRFAGNYFKRDGFTTDYVTGKKYDDRDRYHLRLGVQWEPNERISNYLVGYYFADDESGTSVVASFAGNAPTPAQQAALDLQRRIGPRRVVNSANPRDKTRTWSVTDKLNVELSDNLTLRNIVNYAEYRNSFTYDFDGTGLVRSDIINEPDQYNATVWQVSEEIQLQGTSDDDRLRWIIGAFGDHTEPLGDQLQVNAVPGRINTTRSGVIRSSRAIFAQASFSLGGAVTALEGLTATGGVRYTWDKSRTYTDRIPGGLNVSARNQEPTWTVGLDYQIDPRTMVYAKVARGYKQGGVTPFAVVASRAAYGPEFVTSYEGGVKTSFSLGNVPVRTNLSYYYSKFSGMQRSGVDFDPVTGLFGASTFNVGSATIEGIEFEGTIKPIPQLEISGNYAFMDARYDEYLLVDFVNPGGLDLSGAPFQYAPRHQWSVTGRLELPVPESVGRITAQATYSWQGRTFTGAVILPSQDPDAWIDPIRNLNLSINWDNVLNMPVDASIFVTNATDETYRISYLATRSQGFAGAAWNEPRMWGVRLRYRWGD